MTFFQDVILKPMSLMWLAVTGVATLIGIFGVPNYVTPIDRVLGVLVVALATGFVVLLWASWRIHRDVRTPIGVRQVVNGSHHYSGNLVLILDKGSWIKSEQILVLIEMANNVQSPVAILRLETFTTKNFPQAVVLRSLTSANLVEYLSDPSRWPSLNVISDLKYRYLNGALDE